MNAATEAQIWQWYFEDGMPLRRIAAQVGISKDTVHRAIRRIEKRTLGELKRNVELVKMRQTMQLEAMAATALEQFKKSCEPKVKRRRRRTVLKEKSEQAAAVYGPDIEEIETIGQTGDPGLLNAARACLADVRQIWGLDAPQKFTPTDGDGSELTAEQVQARVEAIMARGRERMLKAQANDQAGGQAE